MNTTSLALRYVVWQIGTLKMEAERSSVQRIFLCITHTVEHNYISPSSTVGIQLHVSAVYVGHLQVVIKLTEQLYKMCGVGGMRSRCFISGYHDLGLL